MNNLNPCVTGDTKVLTVDGLKTFDELANSNDDAIVYCISNGGEICKSRMLHPRITGYNVEIVKITLADGTILKSSYNHEYLTRNGYVSAEEIMEGDDMLKVIDFIEGTDIEVYGDYTGTKKGTVIKTCEVTGEDFETTWEEREVCSKQGKETELYKKMEIIKSGIKESFVDKLNDMFFIPVKSVEFLDKRENVYNGTVAIYHNYFTVDENTNAIINQFNCGE